MPLKNKLYFFEIIIFLIILILEYILYENINYINSFIVISFPLITFIMYKTRGMQMTNKRIKKIVSQITLILVMSFIIVSNLAGLIFGFSKNPINVTLSSILTNTYSLIILIICEELIRYMIAKKCYSNKKYPLIIITLLFILLDIFYITRNEDIINSYMFFVTLTTLIIPAISRNIIASYLSYHVSYMPGIILRLFFGLYPYIFKIYPNYGNYITSIVGLLIPFMLFLLTNKSIKKYEKTKKIAQIDKKIWYICIPIWTIIVSLLILIPGFFKYQIVAIGSGSMEPNVSYGDTVNFEKNIDINKLKKGDIIVFNHNENTIIHRIISIKKDKNSVIINTKGDNNNTADLFDLTEKDIKGKVRMKIKYIGYPTIILSEFFG